MPSELNEVHALMREVESLHTQSGEAELMKTATDAVESAKALGEARNQRAKELVAEMAAGIESRRTVLADSTNEREFANRRAALQADIAGKTARIEELQTQKAAAEQTVEALAGDIVVARARAEEVKANMASEVPPLRSSVSLYANVSQLKWDFGAATPTGLLAADGADTVQEVQMDPAASDFANVNALWDMIGGL